MDRDKENKSTLPNCTGKSKELVSLVEYSDDSIVSKTILDKSAGTITLFAFDKGQRLSEHTTAYDAVVQVIEGSAQLRIGGENARVSAGEIIVMPANIPHSLATEERFKMLLTMIRE